MTKKEIIEYVASCAGVSKIQAGRCIDCYHKAIPGALKRGERVIFRDFGSFSVTKRKAKVGRHPRTGAPLTIAAKKVIKFTQSNKLKEAIKY